ncbi:MAG: Kelch repeat-containing protein [Candidatus Limnocylindrales bacterium]
MAVGRASPHAVLLGDGRVLLVGNDSGMAVPNESAMAELWDPASQAWRSTTALNAPRGEFVAVALADGRAMVAGGIDQGAAGCQTGGGPPGSQASFSSTYLFDARSGGETWTKTGLLGTARTTPAAAVLHDGRVLIAGGYFYTGVTQAGTTQGGVLAAYRPSPQGRPAPPSPGLNDIVLPPAGVALATAELFDPATGAWSSTGALRYARFGAAAVTLADGRVLVVGSDDGSNGQVAKVDDGAYDSAELYDPASGRSSLTGSLPAIDRTAFVKLGGLPDGAPQTDSNGTLVALKDGGALLVGRDAYWKHQGGITRSFRFDATTGTWTEVGTAWATGYDALHDAVWTSPGQPLGDRALVARLADGRVLVAGGLDAAGASLGTAQLFDPATNAWSSLPPMPESRAGGAAVALSDGSVLLVGGFNDATTAVACEQPNGLTSAVRFVPQP